MTVTMQTEHVLNSRWTAAAYESDREGIRIAGRMVTSWAERRVERPLEMKEETR